MTAAPRDPSTSPKLKRWHLDRAAIVYVRRSTPQQVPDHQESTARQYALADRAVAYGWPRARVQAIDDDLGKSGRSIEGRPGPQRLLAEVARDRVGLILGLEMSRPARSCRGWHHLLELCARFRVPRADADADGIHDPTEHSDRLSLGPTGMRNEAEPHVLKRRMHQGKLKRPGRRPSYVCSTSRSDYGPPLCQSATAAEVEAWVAGREVPALWRAPTTTHADRRQVVRLLIGRVVLAVAPGDDRVAARVEWAGGATRERTIRRDVQGYGHQRGWPRLTTRLAELHGRGETPKAIAMGLDRDGSRPPKRAPRFAGGVVRRSLHDLGLRPRVPRRRAAAEALSPGEWWLHERARGLGLSPHTLPGWRRKGWMPARQVGGRGGPWAVWADAAEMARPRASSTGATPVMTTSARSWRPPDRAFLPTTCSLQGSVTEPS